MPTAGTEQPRRPAGERPQLAPRRLLLFAAFTTVVGIAGITGLAEFGARVALGDDFDPGLQMGRPAQAMARFDPDLGWVGLPNLRTRVEAPSFEYVASHNSRGLRDREHDYAKPAGVVRVAVLGDSLTWGWGVDDGESFCDLAEAELGPGVELINFGLPGYGTDQHLWLLEREVARYDPDLVLMCFILNDVVGNNSVDGGGMARRKPRYQRGADGAWVLTDHPVPRPADEPADAPRDQRTVWERLGTDSALMQLLFPPDAEAALARAGAETLGDAPAADPTAAERLDAAGRGKLDQYRATILRLCAEVSDEDSATWFLLGSVARRCAELGAPLVAFTIPHHHDRFLYSPNFPRPDGLERHLEPGAPGFRTELSRHLARAGERLGFETFAVDQALLTETLGGRNLNVGDGHLDAAGHRIVADRVAAELRPRLEALASARD